MDSTRWTAKPLGGAVRRAGARSINAGSRSYLNLETRKPERRNAGDEFGKQESRKGAKMVDDRACSLCFLLS